MLIKLPMALNMKFGEKIKIPELGGKKIATLKKREF
jgi:hypothetical protein